MKSLIRNLSWPAELCIVLLVAVGLQLSWSAIVLANYLLLHVSPHQVWFSDRSVLTVVSIETISLAVVWGIGHTRGWSVSVFGLRPSWKLTGVGLLWGAVMIVAMSSPLFAKTFSFRGALTLPLLISMLAINPFFEEVVEVGYVIHSFEKYGMWPALLASAFLRAALHVYLGLAGFLAVLVAGLIFGLIYWRWKQLWPLVVAHVVADAFILVPLLHHH